MSKISHLKEEYFSTKLKAFCKKYHITEHTAIKEFWRKTKPVQRDENGAVCTICNTYKHWDEYWFHSWTQTGRQTRCKVCFNRMQKEKRDAMIKREQEEEKIIPVERKVERNYWEWIWELVSYWPMRTIVFGKQY